MARGSDDTLNTEYRNWLSKDTDEVSILSTAILNTQYSKPQPINPHKYLYESSVSSIQKHPGPPTEAV